VSHDVYTLPDGLPVPTDDGAAEHLNGDLAKLGVRVAGLSVQDLDDQREFADRNTCLNKYCTLVAEDARIVKVFYPVFPPDANAGEVLRWLQNR